MDKRIVFPGNTDDKRELFFVREDRNYLRKHGGSYHPKVAEYIEKAKPIKDLVQVLLTALGAYEFWGQNVNGDRFREGPLSHEGDTHGYKTFLTNAHYFNHHMNSDPALAKGKILHAVWNDKSKRVELVIGIDINLDPDAVTSIDRGDNLTFSMGAKVPFDVCSICANKAKTRAEYCEHLKYMMNQMDPVSSQLVGADNTIPRFFDISRVLIPADKTAYMWTKVAGAANPYRSIGSAELAELPPGKIADLSYLSKVAEERQVIASEKFGAAKKIAVSKSAEITKRIETTLQPKTVDHLERVIPPSKALLQETSPTLPPEVIARLRELAPSIAHLLSTMIAMGIEPKKEEVSGLLGSEMTQETLSSMELSPDLVSDPVAEVLGPFAGERSFARPILIKRILILAKKLDDGDPEIIKKAETIQDLMSSSVARRPPSIHPGYVAGVLAALYALFGHHAGPMAQGAGKIMANHPLITLALGATGLAALNSLTGTTTTGLYSVDDRSRGLYNNDWQSNIVRMQSRPVTVIKTGAVKKYDSELAKKVFFGIPAIYAASQVAKIKKDTSESRGRRPGVVTNLMASHPDVISGGVLAEHLMGRPISQHVSKAIESGKRLFKHASIQDIEFLSSIPEEQKPLFWDLAILDAATRITEKLGG